MTCDSNLHRWTCSLKGYKINETALLISTSSVMFGDKNYKVMNPDNFKLIDQFPWKGKEGKEKKK